MAQISEHIGAPAIFRGVVRTLNAMGYQSLTEVTLRNGRRADVLAIGPKGDLTIVEVKSCRNDYLTDCKWQDYLDFCDRFYFAVDAVFDASLIPLDTGLLVADEFGGAIIRDCEPSKLAPARRKAMTLKFAQLAAGRLNREQGFV